MLTILDIYVLILSVLYCTVLLNILSTGLYRTSWVRWVALLCPIWDVWGLNLSLVTSYLN
jgi:hypothetical protein